MLLIVYPPSFHLATRSQGQHEGRCTRRGTRGTRAYVLAEGAYPRCIIRVYFRLAVRRSLPPARSKRGTVARIPSWKSHKIRTAVGAPLGSRVPPSSRSHGELRCAITASLSGVILNVQVQRANTRRYRAANRAFPLPFDSLARDAATYPPRTYVRNAPSYYDGNALRKKQRVLRYLN